VWVCGGVCLWGCGGSGHKCECLAGQGLSTSTTSTELEPTSGPNPHPQPRTVRKPTCGCTLKSSSADPSIEPPPNPAVPASSPAAPATAALRGAVTDRLVGSASLAASSGWAAVCGGGGGGRRRSAVQQRVSYILKCLQVEDW